MKPDLIGLSLLFLMGLLALKVYRSSVWQQLVTYLKSKP